MDSKLKLFIKLAEIYETYGFKLFLVGGSVRDYLLGNPLNDMDVVTNATPKEEKEFLHNANYTFEKYGSIKLNFEGVKFDITTLRKETGYVDSRHPNKIIFTDKLIEDVNRRDLTINALYLSKDLEVIDYVNGVEDLNNKLIKMIGDPLTRITEDPLRIVRVWRFKLELGFKVDEDLDKVIRQNLYLLKYLKVDKIKEEVSKSHHQESLLKEIKKSSLLK